MLVDLAMEVKRQIDDPNREAPPSFTRTLWEKAAEKPGTITEREIGYATGSLFGAGSDTTAATIQSFVLAMTCFPRVAAKAQEELDRVVGNTRSPTWEDMPNLPYCNAIIKETLRWRPVAVMGGTPHATSKDDYYEDVFIPKGTTIMGNLWAIHHNPKYFQNSHEFIPERYLEGPDKYGDNTHNYPHRDGHSAFGWVSMLLCSHTCRRNTNSLERDAASVRASCLQKTRCIAQSRNSFGALRSTKRTTLRPARSLSQTYSTIPKDSTLNRSHSLAIFVPATQPSPK